MEDIIGLVKTQYYNILNGKIKDASSVAVPLYADYVPNSTQTKYALLQSIDILSDNAKCDRSVNISVQMLLSTRSIDNNGANIREMTKTFFDAMYNGTAGGRSIFQPYGTSQFISTRYITDFDPSTKNKIIESIITFEHMLFLGSDGNK